MLAGVRDMPQLEVRSLYDLYPDFAIDVEAEQEALLRADVVVWQAPFYWYGLPALWHLWVEKVLANGWAYGAGGTALHGKTALWVARERADRFRRHNLGAIEDLMPRFEDELARYSSSRAGRQQLERQFADDKAALDRAVGVPWSAEPGRDAERLPATTSDDA